MLKPVIMIGCGGSGQKAVRYVRDAVRRRLMHAGWEGDFPSAWQFIGIDTLTVQEDPSIPFLPANDYVSVSLQFNTYHALAGALAVKFPPGSPGFNEMMGWQPRPDQVQVPLKAGAGAVRAVGRAAGVLALQDSVKNRITMAFSECEAGGPQLGAVSQKLGVTVPPGTPTPEPITIVVGSMAGGTGAGIMLDVVDLVRKSHKNGQFPVLVAFTPDIFGALANDQMTANATAFMAEFLSAYWDDEASDDVLIPATVNINTRGPHSTFLIGRKNLDGLDLHNSKNVYRAVGEALAAVTTVAKVQETFHNFINVNWNNYAKSNPGCYGWHDSMMKGAISSLGSTTLSIGRDRFREYLTKLLHRSVIEYLISGFEQAAVSLLGDGPAKGMAGDAKIAELARKVGGEFAFDCQLSSTADRNQVVEQFLSSEIQKSEFQQIVTSIKAALNQSAQLELPAWKAQIASQTQEARRASMKRVEDQVSAEIREWSSKVFQRVLETSTEYSAKYSIPVVLRLIDNLRAHALEASAALRSDASKSRSEATQRLSTAQTAGGDSKGKLNLAATPVNDCIMAYSQSVAYEWKARVQEQLAVTMESIGTGMLSSVNAGLQQALNRLSELATPRDGDPAVVALWPKNDDVVPNLFTPSPVEFFLEEYQTWPSRAKELLERSLPREGRAGLSNDPVQAARTLIIRGGFSKGNDHTVPPLVWVDSKDGAPRWSVGDVATVKVGDDIEEMHDRIEAWLSRPASLVRNFLQESLEDYLSLRDPQSGAPIADHSQRLNTYKQKLQEALNQSRPLLEIDQAMNATVHVNQTSIDTTLNVSGFPFGEGHPAREITRNVVQGYLRTPEDISWIFSGGKTESVLLSSIIKWPLGASVISSFVQPLNQSLARMNNPELLRSSFWLWRRARILENFVPLPDDLRRAAIRGFAIGRALGLVTASVEEQNRIVDGEGVHLFPKHLLTITNINNLLPALLEAMILTFGDAPVRGKAAFSAYGALISLGLGGGLSDTYEVTGPLLTFLKEGSLSYEPIDEKRAAAVKAFSMEERCEKVIQYLSANIERYERVNTERAGKTFWREHTGAVNPTDTLSLEMIDDLLNSFILVRTAVQKIKNDDVDVV